MSKTAPGPSSAKNRVLYNIEIENRANVTRAAKVMDPLPEGMILLDFSFPFASRENGTVVWNVEVVPFETVDIGYLTEALWSGRFESSVEAEAMSVCGSMVQPSPQAPSSRLASLRVRRDLQDGGPRTGISSPSAMKTASYWTDRPRPRPFPSLLRWPDGHLYSLASHMKSASPICFDFSFWNRESMSILMISSLCLV